MSKPNKRHKEKCKQYQTEGRREKNKSLKAERHKKRMDKFAARREAGKNYEYSPNPFDVGTEEYYEEKAIRANKNQNHKTEQAYWDSRWRKLDNDISAEKERIWKQKLKQEKLTQS